jgi:hypothetical protein
VRNGTRVQLRRNRSLRRADTVSPKALCSTPPSARNSRPDLAQRRKTVTVEFATFEAIRHGDAKLELNEPLDWELKGTRLRSTHGLRSALSVPVALVAAVGTFDTHRPTFLIHDGASGRNNACRLDVRGSHWNRRTDQRHWTNQSHLHLWRDDCQDAHAVDPEPSWPPTWFQEHDSNLCDGVSSRSAHN